jgi:hypothetical protein
MEITITLKHGSLNAEFVGEDREEIEQELLQFSEFLDENRDIFEEIVLNGEEEHSQEVEQSEVTQTWDSKSKDSKETTENKFSDVAERARVDQESLVEFLNMPSDEEKVPYLRLDCFEEEEEILGNARYEKQGRASLILCYLWQEFRGIEEVNSSNLNEALHISGINPKNRKNMYKALDGDADGYFTRDSSGDVGLTQGGELAAVDEITRLAEELQSQ